MRRVSCYTAGSGISYYLNILTQNFPDLLPKALILLRMYVLQRGTGLSTPLTTSSMLQMKSALDLVDYLKHFRADNIVNDAEFIRKRIVPGGGPWSILGQVLRFLLSSVFDIFSLCFVHFILCST